MPANYVIVLESEQRSMRKDDVEFADDLQALVTARRIFVEELVVNAARPLCVCLGRTHADGEVAWLNSWKVGY